MPCILEVAINGPHRALSPHEVAREALECLEAGATVVHSHTADVLWATGGRHDPEPYAEAWREIRAQRPGALLYPTMATGAPGIDVADRWAHQEALAAAGLLEIGLVDPGVPARLTGGLDVVLGSAFSDARHMLGRCAALGLTPFVAVFDEQDLRVALTFDAAGRLPPGALVSIVLGAPADATTLAEFADPLDAAGVPWSVALFGAGIVESGLAETALRRGGHVRVGLEDHAHGPGNAEQVRALAALAEACGRPAATPAQTRRLLGRPA